MLQIDLDGKKQRQKLKYLSSTTPFVPGPSASLLCSQLLYLHPTVRSAQGIGNRCLWSVHNTSSLLLLPPHNVPPLQRGSIPQAAALQDKPTSVWAPHRLLFPSGNIHLFHHWVLHSCSVDICSTVVMSTAAGESLLPPSLTLVLAGLFFASFPITSHCYAAFCLFLRTFSPRRRYRS